MASHLETRYAAGWEIGEVEYDVEIVEEPTEGTLSEAQGIGLVGIAGGLSDTQMSAVLGEEVVTLITT